MQTELVKHAFDAAGADGPARLAHFLGDDGRGGFGVEEAMANDLADQFTGTAVVTFGAAFLTDQGGSSFGDKELAELEVSVAC